jgi:hypothetical protein
MKKSTITIFIWIIITIIFLLFIFAGHPKYYKESISCYDKYSNIILNTSCIRESYNVNWFNKIIDLESIALIYTLFTFLCMMNLTIDKLLLDD